MNSDREVPKIYLFDLKEDLNMLSALKTNIYNLNSKVGVQT